MYHLVQWQPIMVKATEHTKKYMLYIIAHRNVIFRPLTGNRPIANLVKAVRFGWGQGSTGGTDLSHWNQANFNLSTYRHVVQVQNSCADKRQSFFKQLISSAIPVLIYAFDYCLIISDYPQCMHSNSYIYTYTYINLSTCIGDNLYLL